MPGDGPATAGGTWVEGTGELRSVDGGDSALQVVHAHRRWYVPLERSVVPVPARTSPARAMEARSGVVPYVDLGARLAAVSGWIGGRDPFTVALFTGRAGAGKTRLAVELCALTEARHWLSGMLRHSVDTLGLAELADTPAPRLIVVDGGENRRSQLEVVLPALRLASSAPYPLRVAILVRSPRQTSLAAPLSGLFGGGADSEAILRHATVFNLDSLSASVAESESLFRSAATAFSHRADESVPRATRREQGVGGHAGESPLSTTVESLLWANRRDDLVGPNLMEGLLRLEEESWNPAPNVRVSNVTRFQRRVVALTALAGARGENEAAQLLSALPELTRSTRQERQRLARWVHALYPGPLWWNPMTRGPLAEYLVASTLRDMPDVIGAVLNRHRAESLVQPLAMLTRICSDDVAFADTVRSVVHPIQDRLRRQAADQVAEATGVQALLSGTILADVLERSLAVIGLPADPARDDLN